MRKSTLGILLALVVTATTWNARAFEGFIAAIPNGASFSCATCHNSPGFSRNSFGEAFGDRDETWDSVLAAMDSDGDGATNGEELGDPTGAWDPGDPNPPGPVTNPGSATSAPPPDAPTITTHPGSQTVTAGTDVTFTVVATGDDLDYQWQRNGTDIPSQTTATLALNDVTAANEGSYTVVVTNPGGSVTSNPATLTVTPVATLAVSITSPADGASFTAPADFTLTATATPQASVTSVEFLRDGTAIGSVSAPPFTLEVNDLGAGSYTFTARATDNTGATATSAPVAVTVVEPPPPGAPIVTVTATDANASEVGPDPGTFRISRTGETTAALTVQFTLGGTAGNGVDYQTLPTSATIAAGAASVDVTVTPILDAEEPAESSETVVLQIAEPAAGQPDYDIGTPASATVTILDSAPAPENEPPFVKLITPRKTAKFKAGRNILLAAVAADPDGTVARVEFFAGTTSLGVGTPLRNRDKHDDDDDGEDDESEMAARMVFVLVWPKVPAGQYEITAVATDNSGATTVSDPVSIKVKARGKGGHGGDHDGKDDHDDRDDDHDRDDHGKKDGDREDHDRDHDDRD